MCNTKISGYPSIDKPWLKYYSSEALHAQPASCTVYQNIYQHNKEHLSETALEYFGVKITFSKLFEHVEACAKALLSNGVRAGDCVTLCTAGTPEAVYIVLACSKIGALANFVNPMFQPAQIRDRINETEASLLFVLDKLHPNITSILSETCIQQVIVLPATNSLPAPMRFLASLKEAPDAALNHELKSNASYCLWTKFIQSGTQYTAPTEASYQKDLPVVMVYSSGTTGASKGIVLTNDGINATIAQYETGFPEVSRQKKFLHIVPIWFSSGISISLLMPLCLGASCILEPLFSPENFTFDIEKYSPNYVFGATSLWLYAMEHLDSEHDLSFLICPITGGEQLLTETESKINDFLSSHHCNRGIQKGWGMCELGATVTFTSSGITAAGPRNKIGSTGIPLPLATVSAFDPDTGKELPYGQRGELQVSTPCCMKEHYQNPDATNAFFRVDEQGRKWGHTGDIGYLDADGFVYVLGRAVDYFIDAQSQKHYLFDIENVILQNPAVDICEVVVLHRDGSSFPVAHILLKKDFFGDKLQLLKELHTHCEQVLPVPAVPSAYKFRDSFSVKPSGKRDTEALTHEYNDYLVFENAAIHSVDFYRNFQK